MKRNDKWTNNFCCNLCCCFKEGALLLTFYFPPYLQKSEYTLVAKKILSQNNEYSEIEKLCTKPELFYKGSRGQNLLIKEADAICSLGK